MRRLMADRNRGKFARQVSPRSARRRSRRLLLEALEERQLLAVDLISVASGATDLGVSASAYSYSSTLAVSDDGRYVVFQSGAIDVVEGDTNGVYDVFVRDLQTGDATRVSVDSSGRQANDDCTQSVISGDGRYVVFVSEATNLVDDDTNGARDVFVKDLQTGVCTRVNTDSSGAQGDQEAIGGTISDDGRYVAFCSGATNLVTGDTNGVDDVFVKDMQTGVTLRVSTSSTGVQGDGMAGGEEISGDGRYVTFLSQATDLVDGDTNSAQDVFLKDLQTGVTTLVSTDSNGVQGDQISWCTTISDDGRYVAFETYATNLVAGDTNGASDVFVRDLQTGVTTRVSTDASGGQFSAYSFGATISDDGRYVGFYNDSTELVAGDTNNTSDVVLKDLLSGAITLVSSDSNGTQGNDFSFCPALSEDGRYVVFESYATNLVDEDVNGLTDVFAKDLQSGATTLVSSRDPSLAGPTSGNSGSCQCEVSADDRYVAFVSDADNLVADDTNDGVDDVFVRDLQTGVTTLVSSASDGTQGDGDSCLPSVSADGRYVAFVSAATNLVDGDTNDAYDVFVKDLQSGVILLISTDVNGGHSDGASYQAVISDDGRYVAFASDATNLVAGDTNNVTDVFVKDLQTGDLTRASTDSSGSQGNGASGFQAFRSYRNIALSNDGRYVAFTSTATNLVVGAVGYYGADAYVKDLQTGTVMRASSNASVADGTGRFCGISGDGRYIVFLSSDDTLVADDTNNVTDVFVTDLQTGVTTRVSTDSDGEQGNQVCWSASISDDGRYVVFGSSATNLVAGDTNGTDDIFVKDLLSGITTRVNVGANGDQARSYSCDPIVSGDGCYVAFVSSAGNLVAGDGNGQRDVFFANNPLFNHRPRGMTLDNSSVVEECAAGALVGTLSTTDPDADDTFTYTLIDDAGGRFTIEGDRVLVDDASLLDYETDASHTIIVATTDAGGLTYQQEFTITVVDVQELIAVDSVAMFDPSTATFYLLSGHVSGAADYTFSCGATSVGWETLVGDWDGDGTSGVGLYDATSSTFYLINDYATGAAEYSFGYGMAKAGWVPVVGDWDGDGCDGVGLYDPTNSVFYLTDRLAAGYADYTFGYGVPNAGWEPLVGDWKGTGRSGVGLYDPQGSSFYLTATLQTGNAEYTFGYGVPGGGWEPLVGDWSGDGATGVGLYDPQASVFYLTDTLATGYAELVFAYGVAGGGWQPLVDDWDGDDVTSVGLYDPAGMTFYLSNTLTTGAAENTVQIAEADADCIPLVGCWSGHALSTTAADAVDEAAAAATSLSSSSPASTAAIDLALASW
jgi:hypothetical protein